MSTNLPHPAAHGEHSPGRGYYDSTLRRWVQRQDQLTGLVDKPPLYGEHVDSFEAWDKRSQFSANPELDQLAKLRDSARPEDRAKADQIITGTTRMQLNAYENAKRAHLEAGGSLPGDGGER